MTSNQLDFYSVATHELGHVLGGVWQGGPLFGGTFHNDSAPPAVSVFRDYGADWARGVTSSRQFGSPDSVLDLCIRTDELESVRAAVIYSGWSDAPTPAPSTTALQALDPGSLDEAVAFAYSDATPRFTSELTESALGECPVPGSATTGTNELLDDRAPVEKEVEASIQALHARLMTDPGATGRPKINWAEWVRLLEGDADLLPGHDRNGHES